MKKKDNINIANAELPIMKVLWQRGELTSPEIFEDIDGNVSTLKTLLKRLVDKKAVGTNKLNSRSYTYYPIISENEYIRAERKGFISRVFDGSKNKMLLNFVKEEEITRSDIEDLLKMIDE